MSGSVKANGYCYYAYFFESDTFHDYARCSILNYIISLDYGNRFHYCFLSREQGNSLL